MIEGLDKGTIIALCSFLGILVAIMVPLITFAVNMLLTPVKAEQKELKNGQARLEGKIINLESKLDLILVEPMRQGQGPLSKQSKVLLFSNQDIERLVNEVLKTNKKKHKEKD